MNLGRGERNRKREQGPTRVLARKEGGGGGWQGSD